MSAANTDINNRQLHETEIALAKKNAAALQRAAQKNGENISLEEATARIEAQLLRWVDAASYKKDSGKTDELVVSVIGMKNTSGGFSWDYRDYAKLHAAEYNDASINKQNIGLYSPLLSKSNYGMTDAEINARNDRAGAKSGKIMWALGTGGLVKSAAKLFLSELVVFASNPLAYCSANSVACLAVVDVVATTTAGMPTSAQPFTTVGGLTAAEIKAAGSLAAGNTARVVGSAGANPAIGYTGAGTTKLDAAAEAAYSKIRMQYMTDVEVVANNVGLSTIETATLKKQLFFGRHEYPLDDITIVRQRFAADHEIAFAWNSAAKGELSVSQQSWLQQLAAHELAERSFMAQGVPYLNQGAWNGTRFTGFPKGAHDMAPPPPKASFPGYEVPLNLLE